MASDPDVCRLFVYSPATLRLQFVFTGGSSERIQRPPTLASLHSGRIRLGLEAIFVEYTRVTPKKKSCFSFTQRRVQNHSKKMMWRYMRLWGQETHWASVIHNDVEI